jgi:multiple sugar transport system ATP-binding protein
MAGVVLENVSRVFPAGARTVDSVSGKGVSGRSADGTDARGERASGGGAESSPTAAAVNNVSLEVVDREFLVLVGPSGCGKTTTLRMIAGLEAPSAGTIRICNRVVNDVPPKDRDIAMVFQNYALYPHLSVYRNLAFGLELRERLSRWDWLWRWAMSRRRRSELAARRYEVARLVRETARTLGIEDLLERLPGQLSGGERQRVALGRAIVRKPAVFLFDEPLSNLDAKLRVDMRRELKQLHERLQTTMIYVTHDQVEALTLGDRIVVMNEGSIQQVGKPMELYDWPVNRFVASFIGTPGMNFLEGMLTDRPEGAKFSRDNFVVGLPRGRLRQEFGEPRAVRLGFRPEDVRVSLPTADTRTCGIVRLVETLGDSSIATIEVSNTQWDGGEARIVHQQDVFNVVSKIEPRRSIEVGQWVGVEIDSSRAHVFDARSEESLVSRPAGA